VLQTSFIPNAGALLGNLFDINAVSFVHPLLALLETQLEPSDPLASTPRLHENPLPSHAPISVYEPVGDDDEYFPTTIYDAMALGYDHVEGGAELWTSMQDALTLDGRQGLSTYPIFANRPAPMGMPNVTAAVIQYQGDGVSNSHYIYVTLDDVKYQYRCFFVSALRGAPTIYAPAALTTACPAP
jgi:hypothetical protein